MFRQELSLIIKKAVPPSIEPEVTVPENENFGHYSTNVAFALAKIEKKQPIMVARKLARAIEQEGPLDFFKKIDAVEPGFINFWIHDRVLLRSLDSVLSSPEKWGVSKDGEGRTVMVEYFQPNVAKIIHIGHLRSAVIGDALKRMFLSQGYRAVSDTHIGDWGTQFGILLYAYKELGEVGKRAIEKSPIDGLNKLYVEESRRIEEDPSRREKAKEEFAKLERGDNENRKIWQWMLDVSMEVFLGTIKQLELLSFDEHRGESIYEEAMPEIVEFALKKNVAKKTSDGAIVVDLTKEGLDEAVLIKSDGASTYLLRDLATIKHRKEKWDFWKNLYVVDVRQSLYFKQVFRVAELLGFIKFGECEHVEFGFMSLKEGALSTRKGNVIALQEVVDGVVSLAREVIKEKNPDLKNADEVAWMVGLGALKYFDLSHHRKSNIVFDREKSLSFDGNTGPYIQYTHARFCSILRKGDMDSHAVRENFDLDEAERSLLVSILRFPEMIELSLRELAPNTLANYLFQLAQKANEFYHSHPVLQEQDEEKKKLRLALVRAVSITLSRGLGLLGIGAPEEM